MDLIIGLLKPDSGQVLVDETNIEDSLESWQKKISYVPQTTFLTDTTILENITFGIKYSDNSNCNKIILAKTS